VRNGNSKRIKTKRLQDLARVWGIVHTHNEAPSVVVFIIYFVSILALEAKGDPPIAAD
jgi:hypothetical protein